MDEHLNQLVAAVARWRQQGSTDHWVRFSYMGPVLHFFGDHTVAFLGGSTYHAWQGDWRQIQPGGDFWLFTVPGTFAWARDMITKVAPAANAAPDALTIQYDPTMGYVSHIRARFAKRDEHNFTLDVRKVGTGAPDDFSA